MWIPELGKAWYMGWKGPQPPLRMWLANYKENMMPAMNTRFRLCIEHFKLRERVQAAREGKAIEPSPAHLADNDDVLCGGMMLNPLCVYSAAVSTVRAADGALIQGEAT